MKTTQAQVRTTGSVPTRRCLFLGLVTGGLLIAPAVAIDANGNGLNDVWEMIYGVSGLAAGVDSDGDGFTNGQESAAGTNPFDPNSRPLLGIATWTPSHIQLGYPRIAGKRYQVESKTDLSLATWATDFTEVSPNGAAVSYLFSKPPGTNFWRLRIDDADTDIDGLLDAEERWLGFDPATNRTDRNDTTDLSRVTAGLSATSVVTLGVLNERTSERWPSPGVVVVRRSGGLKPITVNVSFSGTASLGADYSSTAVGNIVTVPAGVREVPVLLTPVADADDGEGDETIIATVQAGAGYTPGATISGTVTIENETVTSLPREKAAARFLLQAAFGPDQDSSADADEIPENVEEVMAMGFSAWIDDQFTRPVGLIQPWVDWAAVNASGLGLYGNWKQFAWWSRALGAPKLRPDDPNDPVTNPFPYDPLRQRVAFALSEILVASDRPETIAVEQRGMANFYDLFEQHAFGNYGDILQAVTRHPVMGIYLSHLGNQKANPATNFFPDENFAREIMQLFSIGLWRLNPDGTQYHSDGTDLDPAGNIVPAGYPIPTYTNADITELARVFTGLSFGNNVNFQLYPRDFTVPMKGWDDYHDLGAKTLLGGLTLPAQSASPGSTGTATMADVTAAVNHLFHHPNTGPFVAYRLIQRLVASNPSSAYVGRVAAAFANNGFGVRGDMKAVVKAILLDADARDPAMMSQPTWGKLREPLLGCANLARAFNASAPAGYFALDQFALAHLQDPMNAPSVFNFFLPTHSPSGPLAQQGLVAPEFQIVNASTAVSGANYFWNHILGDLQFWGAGNANYSVRLNLNDELAMIVPAAQIPQNVPAGPSIDPDPLLRRLNLALTGGTLSPRQFQIIREALLRINPPTWQWHRERLRLAVYLITTSPEFNVLR